MTKLFILFILLIVYITVCIGGYPFRRRIPEQEKRYNKIYYIPSIIDDPDALPNGILLQIFDDHFGSRFQITNQYGTSREMPLSQLPSGYIDEKILSHDSTKVLPFKNGIIQKQQNPLKRIRNIKYPKKGRKYLKIVHENPTSDLDENIINNEILRYFSLTNFGLFDDDIFSFK